MMTFRVRLKKTKQSTQSKLRFDLEKSRIPSVTGTFKAIINEKFAPLLKLRDDNKDIDSMITTYNTAVVDTESEIFEKERCIKNPR